MATTLTRSRPSGDSEVGDLRFEPRTSRRRRPVLALLSALLVVLSITVFTSLYLRAGNQVSVLAVAQPVAQGDVLTAADLTVVRISLSSGVSAIDADMAGSVVGRRVAMPLVPGALLVATDISSASSPPSGYAIVGVALKPGQLPASGVFAGETVDVVMTGVPGAPYTASDSQSQDQSQASVSGPGTILAPGALVTDVAPPSASAGSDNVVVSLEVSRALAPVIASSSAAGQAALVVVASGS